MKLKTTSLTLFSALIPFSVLADNYIWIIGGGPTKENSQVQIERNVKWARNVIASQSPKTSVKVFYTDGDDPSPDVVHFLKRDLSDHDYLLDLVLAGPDISHRVFRNHTIENHAGSTHPDNLVPVLKKDFTSLDNNDQALVLYNGHGWGNSSDYSLNNFRLWNETPLTVYEFEQVISALPDKVPFRFIVTQCYSGGFAHLVHPGANGDTMELKGKRCGFMAESARREAEGCSSSLKVGQYRDYTTYMFAALDGKTRLNEKLASNPDLDGNNRISLREAHLYTLSNAYSTDLSRSTSEYYLEKWQPWYLRWLPGDKRRQDSVYREIQKQLVQANELPESVITDPVSLRAEKNKKHALLVEAEQQMNSLRGRIKEVQQTLSSKLEQQYPGIKKAYKDEFKNFSQDTVKSAVQALLTSSATQLNELNQLMIEKDQLDLVMLDAERAYTQVEKVERMGKLSKLDSLFRIFANSETTENLDTIISCEETYL